MSPKEEMPVRPLTQRFGKGLLIKISNGITYPHCKYFVIEDGVILISVNRNSVNRNRLVAHLAILKTYRR